MTKSYRDDAMSDAASTIEEYIDEIVAQLMDAGTASDDLLNDYPNGDSYHHESHVDKSYRLTEAAELLESLSDFEETDSGLWEGLAPREAISAMAAYTYGIAVYSMWRDYIEQINSEYAEKLADSFTELDEALSLLEDADAILNEEESDAYELIRSKLSPDAEISDSSLDEYKKEAVASLIKGVIA